MPQAYPNASDTAPLALGAHRLWQRGSCKTETNNTNTNTRARRKRTPSIGQKLAQSFLELAATADELMRDPKRAPEDRKLLRQLRSRNLDIAMELMGIEKNNQAEAESYQRVDLE